jgi:uncharacterized protein YlxW (UPF0749 family)
MHSQSTTKFFRVASLLDALEKAADERIAAKEAYLAQLTENVQQKQQEVNRLKEVVKRYENAVNRMNN